MSGTYRLSVQYVLGCWAPKSDGIGLLIDSYAYNRPNTSQVANAINSGRGLPWPILGWLPPEDGLFPCIAIRRRGEASGKLCMHSMIFRVFRIESMVYFYPTWVVWCNLSTFGLVLRFVASTKGNLDLGFLVRSPGESFFSNPIL